MVHQPGPTNGFRAARINHITKPKVPPPRIATNNEPSLFNFPYPCTCCSPVRADLSPNFSYPHARGESIPPRRIGPRRWSGSPLDPTRPVDRHLADKWLCEAERKAGLEHLPGGAWHPFRRKVATELKGAPDKDVMALLGWRDLQSLKEAYQHADPASMLVALESRRELREAR